MLTTSSIFADPLDNACHYRALRVLGRSDHEHTLLVVRQYDTGEIEGPFVMKRIPALLGIGSAYETLHRAFMDGHPIASVPAIIDCFEDGETLVVVQQFAEGNTLREVVACRSASESLAADLFPRICDAVASLHELPGGPLIHRDLTPTNIIVSYLGVQLIDFSIARVYDPNVQCDTARFGTKAFAPPEQYGFGQTDVRSDVFALGMCLLFLLTGDASVSPYEEKIAAAEKVSAGLSSVARKAVSFSPDDRYQSVESLKRAFLQAAAEARSSAELFGEGGAASVENVESDALRLSPMLDASDVHPSRSYYAEPLPDSRVLPQPPAPDALQPNGISAPKANKWLAFWKSDRSKSLGVAWNTLLVCIWGIFLVCTGLAVVHPNGEAHSPLPLRFVEYYGTAGVWCTALLYPFLDKREFKKRFAWFRGRTFAKDVALSVIVSAVSFFLFMMMVVAIQL